MHAGSLAGDNVVCRPETSCDANMWAWQEFTSPWVPHPKLAVTWQMQLDDYLAWAAPGSSAWGGAAAGTSGAPPCPTSPPTGGLPNTPALPGASPQAPALPLRSVLLMLQMSSCEGVSCVLELPSYPGITPAAACGRTDVSIPAAGGCLAGRAPAEPAGCAGTRAGGAQQLLGLQR